VLRSSELTCRAMLLFAMLLLDLVALCRDVSAAQM
jgi:hypothetical protein